jgi:hypothetical protein
MALFPSVAIERRTVTPSSTEDVSGCAPTGRAAILAWCHGVIVCQPALVCAAPRYSRAINRASVRMPSAIRSDHGVPAEIRMKLANRWRAENSGPGATTIRRRSA